MAHTTMNVAILATSLLQLDFQNAATPIPAFC
jgi:hypothetical protein